MPRQRDAALTLDAERHASVTFEAERHASVTLDRVARRLAAHTAGKPTTSGVASGDVTEHHRARDAPASA